MLEALAGPDGSLDVGLGGLGLGLTLIRGIVELHGGTVKVQSDGMGRGAAFAFRLPLAEPAAPAPAHGPTGSPEPAARLRVLVVEDNADAAESLRRLLRMHGHDVSVAVNGFDGVAEAKRSHPDAIVCDIGLPGMDGYAVASALRGDPDTARARLIAVTGYGRAEDRARALSSGFDEHIVKPADPDLLLSKLAASACRC
jgi:CheY-like chemotaxis protein